MHGRGRGQRRGARGGAGRVGRARRRPAAPSAAPGSGMAASVLEPAAGRPGSATDRAASLGRIGDPDRGAAAGPARRRGPGDPAKLAVGAGRRRSAVGPAPAMRIGGLGGAEQGRGGGRRWCRWRVHRPPARGAYRGARRWRRASRRQGPGPGRRRRRRSRPASDPDGAGRPVRLAASACWPRSGATSGIEPGLEGRAAVALHGREQVAHVDRAGRRTHRPVTEPRAASERLDALVVAARLAVDLGRPPMRRRQRRPRRRATEHQTPRT